LPSALSRALGKWCRHGTFSLSRAVLGCARQKALSKEAFADDFFAEPSLPSAALGKAFAECILLFAECGGRSAKNLSPVVV
jgi:hypothetical protein